ncbi:YqiA/YcfP family alpha/beta fold hydrolase [Orrella sp. JC864]|uniref:YqiA/YcfP family alpha/beta fold hydrolase n=1 Tax=Orrella sp. JC864 TaxID=3120298 RepID=UPI00300B3193
MILYLHGFGSSPDSYKARLMAQAMQARGLQGCWRCPQLPVSPREAAGLALRLAHALLALPRPAHLPEGPEALTVVGSSLGGYYAAWLAQQTGCKAVLLNPAVHAPRELARRVGPHRMYHSDAPFVFEPHYVDELAALAVPPPGDARRFLLLAATGDEVLDWREMRDFYQGCRQVIIEGSDHGLTGFERWLPEVLAFAGVPEPPAAAAGAGALPL